MATPGDQLQDNDVVENDTLPLDAGVVLAVVTEAAALVMGLWGDFELGARVKVMFSGLMTSEVTFTVKVHVSTFPLDVLTGVDTV